MIKILIFVMAILTVACSLPGGEVPVDHFYRLPPVHMDAVSTTARNITLSRVTASGVYHERAMLYVDANEPQEIKRYSYHYWSDTPANLIQDWMQGRLEKNTDLMPPIDLRIHIVNFERLIGQGKAEAYIRMRVEFNSNKNLSDKLYEARVEAASTHIPDTVRAFGQALDVISEEILKDISH